MWYESIFHQTKLNNMSVNATGLHSRDNSMRDEM